jgi:integrase
VGEAKRLTWSQVDFENGILIIPREQTKSDREHRLPLSDFLVALLKKRYLYGKNSQWVFQSSKHKNKPLGGGVGMLRRLRAKSQIHFSFHSLRRTFMSTGGKLKIPEYVLKRLANHSVANDMTGRYVVLDIELLRSYMTQITNTFLPLLGIDECKKLEWQADLSSSPTAFTQLQIPLKSTSIM